MTVVLAWIDYVVWLFIMACQMDHDWFCHKISYFATKSFPILHL